MAKRRKQGSALQNVIVGIVVLAAVAAALYFGDTQPESTPVGGQGNMPVVHSEDPFDAVFLDVGQGACVILTSRGQTVLIDAGESDQDETVLNALKEMGVQKLDLVIGTHIHSDHVGSLPSILTQMNADRVLMPQVGRDTTLFSQIEYAGSVQNLAIETPQQGESIQLGDMKLTLHFSDEDKDLNESSIVTTVEAPGVTLLLTGDAGKSTESQLIAAGCLPEVDIMQVGHHGSSGSTGKALLETVSPTYAVIQVGAGNSYGHPTASTLKSLYDFGIRVLRNDECGNIYVDVDGAGGYTVTSERETEQPYAAQTKEAA
ncbi:MAG: MBL fold metallo-hydrolase [Eubacteriales bacterium]|nr:MBL fold metallo-hydrolase [Eubacteriales bacterium]